MDMGDHPSKYPSRRCGRLPGCVSVHAEGFLPIHVVGILGGDHGSDRRNDSMGRPTGEARRKLMKLRQMRGGDLPWVWDIFLETGSAVNVNVVCRVFSALHTCCVRKYRVHQKRETRQLFGEAGLDTEKGVRKSP
jgi:hypothetical protein